MTDSSRRQFLTQTELAAARSRAATVVQASEPQRAAQAAATVACAESVSSMRDAGDRIHPVKVDATDRPSREQAVADTVKQFGGAHVIVVNAGVQNHVSLSKMSVEDWTQLKRVNVEDAFYMVQTFLPHIQTHGEDSHQERQRCLAHKMSRA